MNHQPTQLTTDGHGRSYALMLECPDCGNDLCGFTHCACGWDAYEWADRLLAVRVPVAVAVAS